MNEIQQLAEQVRKLKKCCCKCKCECECMQQPFRVLFQGNIWDTALNGNGEIYYVQKSDEELNINDRLPGVSCHFQKADLLCNDGILFCHYNIGSPGDPAGWVSDKAYYIPQP